MTVNIITMKQLLLFSFTITPTRRDDNASASTFQQGLDLSSLNHFWITSLKQSSVRS